MKIEYTKDHERELAMLRELQKKSTILLVPHQQERLEYLTMKMMTSKGYKLVPDTDDKDDLTMYDVVDYEIHRRRGLFLVSLLGLSGLFSKYMAWLSNRRHKRYIASRIRFRDGKLSGGIPIGDEAKITALRELNIKVDLTRTTYHQ